MPTPSTNAYGTGPEPPKPTVQSGQTWVRRVFPTGEQFEEQHLNAHVFATAPAEVRAMLSRTVNLGNFESVRLEIGASLPCYAEEVEKGIDAVTELVGRHLQAEIAALKK